MKTLQGSEGSMFYSLVVFIYTFTVHLQYKDDIWNLLYQHHCGDVKGQILFSPVDGFDPFGWIDNFVVTPGEYLNYALPSLGKRAIKVPGGG